MRLLCALILFVVLAGCDATVDPDPLSPSRWALVSGAEAEGAAIRFGLGGSFTANPVCNSVWGTYAAGRSRIGVNVVGSTRAYCGEGTAAEGAFISALTRVSGTRSAGIGSR